MPDARHPPPRHRAARLALGGYAALLAFGSLWPAGMPSVADPLAWMRPTWQNVLHVPAYAGLVVLLAAAWPLDARRRAAGLAARAAACVVFGTAMELAQAVIPGRTGSLTDALLNVVGVALGLVAGIWTALPAHVAGGVSDSDAAGGARPSTAAPRTGRR